jgi:hypothetical protein
MRQKSVTGSSPSERLVKTIRRATRKQYSAEEKIKLDDATAAMISAIEVDADGRLTRIRLWDKNAALEKAMKHLGLYNRDDTQRRRAPQARPRVSHKSLSDAGKFGIPQFFSRGPHYWSPGRHGRNSP